jgi:hypothetical protein
MTLWLKSSSRGAEAAIHVEYEDAFRRALVDYTLKDRVSVCVRRHLAGFRDNHLSKSEFLLRIVARLKTDLHRR